MLMKIDHEIASKDDSLKKGTLIYAFALYQLPF